MEKIKPFDRDTMLSFLIWYLIIEWPALCWNFPQINQWFYHCFCLFLFFCYCVSRNVSSLLSENLDCLLCFQLYGQYRRELGSFAKYQAKRLKKDKAEPPKIRKHTKLWMYLGKKKLLGVNEVLKKYAHIQLPPPPPPPKKKLSW